MKRTKIIDIFRARTFGFEVNVKGWVRTSRGNKQVTFILLNDGSTMHSLQIVVDRTQFDEALLRRVTTGAALSVTGKIVESMGCEQNADLVAKSIEIVGDCDPVRYPLQPKRHSLEFLREIAHLRFRTNTFGAIARIRHAVTYGIHSFFTSKGFVNIHTPIITASDAEGAGETFRVTTLNLENPPRNSQGQIDYRRDFFGKSTNLTVSGQLEGELAAMGLSDIYTFGPTFRAEKSNTSRHLAEFWMVEPEMAFYDLKDNMNLAEEFLRYLLNYTMSTCMEELKFLSRRQGEEEKNKKPEERSMELLRKLDYVQRFEFMRLTYDDAIEILQDLEPSDKEQFKYQIQYGDDLQSEHERFLVEKYFRQPIIITDYPKEIKAFYMKQNPDGKTVRAMDVLFPQIGEIIGGSQREENYDKLLNRMKELGIPEKEMWWYLETRRFGSVPHSGFGLGLDRFLQFVTGMSNIRDVIPFPRTPNNVEF
ncbi:MAG: asparagine--tRNA ligase [Prevotellaceae bacterium]|jgi:asparaginyl-tRNA synthetase|nr:asparagine--tRNA ligase [Prevotellaceae bacterium]